MKKIIVAAALALSCKGPVTPDQVEQVGMDVLNATQLLCILGSGLTSAPAVVDFCKLDSALTPAVEQFLSAAKTANVGRLYPVGK